MFRSFFVLSLLLLPCISQAAVWAAQKPKLVVLLVIDQFRADYLTRYQGKFGPDGFKALMSEGAYFPYGEYDILQSMTGPGHATILTGAYPYQMGIPINEWYDQKTHSKMYCAENTEIKNVGTATTKPHLGTSPKNLIGTTVGDEFKNADFPSTVVSIAIKDRAAILMGGHRADLALWYDNDADKWVSSQYYLRDGVLPTWVRKLNARKPKCDLVQPCGVQITVDAFKQAVDNYKLGQKTQTDIIAVSFSSHDFAGHQFGPNSQEMEAMTLAEDRAIADIRSFLKSKVSGGLKNTLIILTGDHGIPSTPAYLQSHGVPSGNIDEEALTKEAEELLTNKYGKPLNGKWIPQVTDFNFYIDEDSTQKAKVELATVEQDIKTVLVKNADFAHVITAAEIESRHLPPGVFERQILKTYYKGRSGHVIGIQKPFYINVSHSKANHMTGYSYDKTVPILFSGFGIKNGLYADKAEVIDIAPTLSFLLGVVPPALSEGKVLKSALK